MLCLDFKTKRGEEFVTSSVNLFQKLVTQTSFKKNNNKLTFSDQKLQLQNLVDLLSLSVIPVRCKGYICKYDFYSLSLSVCVKINLFCLDDTNLKERLVLFYMTTLCPPVLTSFFCKFFICFQNVKKPKLLGSIRNKNLPTWKLGLFYFLQLWKENIL